MTITFDSESIGFAWYNISKNIIRNGEWFGNIIELRNFYFEFNCLKSRKYTKDEIFDKHFRDIFGDERIDYAEKVTFISPNSLGVYKPDKKYKYFYKLVSEFGFNQIENSIKKLSLGKNIKTCQMVVFSPKDVKKVMGQPCIISINCSPRNGVLNLSVAMRSMAFSKSGYADISALLKMGYYISSKSNLVFGSLGVFTPTCHLRKENGEYKKVLKMIELLEKIYGKKKKNFG